MNSFMATNAHCSSAHGKAENTEGARKKSRIRREQHGNITIIFFFRGVHVYSVMFFREAPCVPAKR
ncbi:hypothetical protein McpCs1_18190 [Methanocorpusculaceae archaeon Cs1]|uniref:Uncharacterized protein n=1 Tax=Methanorbis rubei TaxID=3028300 RepID=A0AAE4SEA8_9EURY|nr:hypothetical protein [Methanocorpusculaceae archaeon Cs1]